MAAAALVRWLLAPMLLVATLNPLLAQTAVDKPGTEQKSTKIKCGDTEGTVSVNTNVQFTVTAKPNAETVIDKHALNGISIGYKGTNCGNCKWLQFVYRELYATPVGGAEVKLPEQPLNTPEGSYKSSDKTPNYHVDSGSPTDPGYEAAGANIRTGDSTTMFDQPASSVTTNDPKVASIRSVAHYDAFLICGGKVCVKVSWTATHVWTPGGGVGPTSYSDLNVDPSGTPNDAQKTALNDQYKGQTLLK